MNDVIAIKRFVTRLTIIFFVLIVISAVAFKFFIPQHYFSFAPVVFLYFYLINILSFRLLVKSSKLPTAGFSKYFMAITGIKFFGSLVFAFIYMILAKDSIIPFLVIFIILYFLSLIQIVRGFLGFLGEKKSH